MPYDPSKPGKLLPTTFVIAEGLSWNKAIAVAQTAENAYGEHWMVSIGNRPGQEEYFVEIGHEPTMRRFIEYPERFLFRKEKPLQS